MKNNNTNVKHVSLQPGMYIFSYVRALTPNSNPVAVFSKRPHFGSGTMSCLYSNEKLDGQLSSPGECAVVRVGQNSIQLQVNIYDDQNSNPDIEFKIDTLYQQKPLPAKNRQVNKEIPNRKLETVEDLNKEILKARQTQSPQENIINLALSGHLEWKGDVSKKPGKWLGHSKSTKRLEAFSIDWPDRPKGVNLKYTCKVKNIGTFPPVKCGNMVGTIQRALPIIEVQVAVSGKKSADYQVKVQAAFLETGVQQQQDKKVAIKAIHDNEFLTGLKVVVVKIPSPLGLPGNNKPATKQKKVAKVAKKKDKKTSNWNNFDDVMVFKS